MTRPAAVGLAVAILVLAPAPTAADLRLERHTHGDAIALSAWLDVDASPEDVWSVITDYDGMSRFVPGLKRSQRVARTPEGPVVDQEGVARVFLVGARMSVRLQMREVPPMALAFRALSGDLKPFSGVWEIDPAPNGRSRLGCRCSLRRRSGMPASAMAWVAGEELKPRMRALGREAERRARLAGRAAPPKAREKPWFWPF